jgi:hypothetical protein
MSEPEENGYRPPWGPYWPSWSSAEQENAVIRTALHWLARDYADRVFPCEPREQGLVNAYVSRARRMLKRPVTIEEAHEIGGWVVAEKPDWPGWRVTLSRGPVHISVVEPSLEEARRKAVERLPRELSPHGEVIRDLLLAMESWGSDEEGIHPDAWAIYERGRAAIGYPVNNKLTEDGEESPSLMEVLCGGDYPEE